MNKKKTSSISESVKARFQVSSSTKKLLLDLFVLFQLLSGTILSLSLLTYSIDDFQWRESIDVSVRNSIGLVGAWISSFLYSFLGLTAWIISLVLFINPLNYYLSTGKYNLLLLINYFLIYFENQFFSKYLFLSIKTVLFP